MEKQVVDAAFTQGIWAVLTVVLIFYILKSQENRDFKQEEREKGYQSIIAELTERLGVVDDIKKEIVNLSNRFRT